MSESGDEIKPVSCTIKPPVYLHIGETKTDPAHSGVCVVDVTLPFGKPVNVSPPLPKKPVYLKLCAHDDCASMCLCFTLVMNW